MKYDKTRLLPLDFRNTSGSVFLEKMPSSFCGIEALYCLLTNHPQGKFGGAMVSLYESSLREKLIL